MPQVSAINAPTPSTSLQFTVGTLAASAVKTLPARLGVITATDDITITWGKTTARTPAATDQPIWGKTYFSYAVNLRTLDSFAVYNPTGATVTVTVSALA